ncbi:MAG: hypothetical protein KDD52_03305 [Bdellovibrionales bacterium]|nr:hypothetical protein [Bdellovibrionales bacterium]
MKHRQSLIHASILLPVSLALFSCSILDGERPTANISIERPDRMLRIQELQAKSVDLDLQGADAYYKFAFFPSDSQKSIQEIQAALPTLEDVTGSDAYDIAEAFSAYGGAMIDRNLVSVNPEETQNETLKAILESSEYRENILSLKETCIGDDSKWVEVFYEKPVTGIFLDGLEIGKILPNETPDVLRNFLGEDESLYQKALEYAGEKAGYIQTLETKNSLLSGNAQSDQNIQTQIKEIKTKIAQLDQNNADVLAYLQGKTLANIPEATKNILRKAFTPKVVTVETGAAILKMGLGIVGAAICVDPDIAQSKGYVIEQVGSETTFFQDPNIGFDSGKIRIVYGQTTSTSTFNQQIEGLEAPLGKITFKLENKDATQVWRKPSYQKAAELAIRFDHYKGKSSQPIVDKKKTENSDKINENSDLTTEDPSTQNQEEFVLANLDLDDRTTKVRKNENPTNQNLNGPDDRPSSSGDHTKPAGGITNVALDNINSGDPQNTHQNSTDLVPNEQENEETNEVVLEEETPSIEETDQENDLLPFQTGSMKKNRWGTVFFERLEKIEKNFYANHWPPTKNNDISPDNMDIGIVDKKDSETLVTKEQIDTFYPLYSYAGIEFDEFLSQGSFVQKFDRVFAPFEHDAVNKRKRLRDFTSAGLCNHHKTKMVDFGVTIKISPNTLSENQKYQKFLYDQLRSDIFFGFKDQDADAWRLDYLDRFLYVGKDKPIDEKISFVLCLNETNNSIELISSIPSEGKHNNYERAFHNISEKYDRIVVNDQDLLAFEIDLHYILGDLKSAKYLRVSPGQGFIDYAKENKNQRILLNAKLKKLGKEELSTNTTTKVHAVMWLAIPYDEVQTGGSPKVYSLKNMLTEPVLSQGFKDRYEISDDQIQRSDGYVLAPGSHDAMGFQLTFID